MMPHNGLPKFIPNDIVFESFTFPFFDSNYRCNPRALSQVFLDSRDQNFRRGKRGLYVHIPFCETMCSFCPFIKSVPSQDRVYRYLKALHREIELVAATPLAQSWLLDAIYIGGGTPSVLSPDQIFKLIQALIKNFSVADGFEFTVEVEPKSASAEFCHAAASAGANRISFGVQTFNPKFRQFMNLTATLEDISNLAENSRTYFPIANFDMIVGYPGQTHNEVVEDMSLAIALDVGNVSVFPLDYIASTPSFLDRIRRGQIPAPPSSEARWEMFHIARQTLMKRYTAQNMYFFGRPEMPGCRYMFDILYGGYFDQCIGVGLSSYSMLAGLSYANVQDEGSYIRILNGGVLPISIASPGHAYEKSYVYMGKRTRVDMAEAIELGIDSVVGPKLEALVDAGLAKQTSESAYVLTAQGERVYAQIMVGFLSDGQRRLYERACARMKGLLNWGLDGAAGSVSASARGSAVRNTLQIGLGDLGGRR